MTDTLLTRLIDAGLHHHAAVLAGQALPGIRLRVDEIADDDWTSVTTKLGGAPDLPAGTVWPRWQDTPLAFVGQLHLPELRELTAASALPDDGLLSFFHHPEQQTWGFDPADAGSFRVLWFAADEPLVRTGPPRDMPPHGRHPAGRLVPEETVSLPPYPSIGVDALDLTDDEKDAYFQLWDSLVGDEPAPHHQVLGHPIPVQGEMQLECQLVTHGLYCGDRTGYEDPRRIALESGASEWRLLLQVDSDEQLDMAWGDGGMLYYWIRQSDLARRDFDRVWLILQCS